jgi:hypothetical protein
VDFFLLPELKVGSKRRKSELAEEVQGKHVEMLAKFLQNNSWK